VILVYFIYIYSSNAGPFAQLKSKGKARVELCAHQPDLSGKARTTEEDRDARCRSVS